MGSAGIGTCENDRGCRGINGPVPPPLWMSMIIRQILVTSQAALLLKGGGSGLAVKPPNHYPLFPRMLSSYKYYYI
jgi:hypothetical protein